MEKSLEQFINGEKEKLERFRIYWTSQHHEDLFSYPMTMEIEDWVENFQWFEY